MFNGLSRWLVFRTLGLGFPFQLVRFSGCVQVSVFIGFVLFSSECGQFSFCIFFDGFHWVCSVLLGAFGLSGIHWACSFFTEHVWLSLRESGSHCACSVLQVAEEQPVGSFVTTIRAEDPYESIARYDIISDPSNLFDINSFTGKNEQVLSLPQKVLEPGRNLPVNHRETRTKTHLMVNLNTVSSFGLKIQCRKCFLILHLHRGA